MPLIRRVIWMITVVSITGCAAMHSQVRNPFADYPFRHDSFDFNVAWKTVSLGKNIAVDGVLKNVRYSQVSDIQLWVKLRNKDKKILAEESTLLLPVVLNTDETLPFSVTLRNAELAKGDMLNFVMLYRVNDDSKSSSSWLSSFTVDAATGVETASEETKQDRR